MATNKPELELEVFKIKINQQSHLVSVVLPVILTEVPDEGCHMWIEGLILSLDHLATPSAHLDLGSTLTLLWIYPDKKSVNTKDIIHYPSQGEKLG